MVHFWVTTYGTVDLMVSSMLLLEYRPMGELNCLWKTWNRGIYIC